MLYSHRFPLINLHTLECLFCVGSVRGIEELELFKTVAAFREPADMETGKGDAVQGTHEKRH